MVQMEMMNIIIFQKKKRKSQRRSPTGLKRGNTKKRASIGKTGQQIVETTN